jgi:pyrroloquinoline quinone (PQQ) biosynthesis protein C
LGFIWFSGLEQLLKIGETIGLEIQEIEAATGRLPDQSVQEWTWILVGISGLSHWAR